jgi:hypothetical protein
VSRENRCLNKKYSKIIRNKLVMKNYNFSKVLAVLSLPILFMVFGQTAFAQVPATQQLPDTAKMTYNQISKSCDLFVYPSNGQSKQQQKEDEFECYMWAMEQSGVDPLNLPKVEAAPAQSGPTGAGVVGGAKGAAAGAAIGAIAGDAGKGAAIGAVAGGLAGRRAGKQGQAQANQQSQANAASTEAEIWNSFVKAFSVCIEGKGYTIK